LRLLNKRVGLLINFHVRVLKDGVTRVVNDFPDQAKSAASENGISYKPLRSLRSRR
jgi:hypothetical protein